MKRQPVRGARSFCDHCGKGRYLSRKEARQVMRRLHLEQARPYQCPHSDVWWHIGHFPSRVKRGEITVREITQYRKKNAR